MTLVLLSCKSQKKAIDSSAADQTAGSDDLNKIRFGSMYVDACAERMKGNLQEALKLFNSCKKIDPTSAPVKYELGTIYKLLGINDLAIDNAKACAQADPKNEWYQLLLVECYNSVRQYDQAIKVREALVKNFPDKTDFKEDLAIDYISAGQYDKAFKIYESLERIYGITEQITLNKVKLLKGLKRLKEAEAELIKLSDTNKNESRYYSYLADFYMEINALEKARKVYDRILLIDPNNPLVNLALHDYYSAQGKGDEAFEYLKKAFQNPDLEVGSKAGISRSFYQRVLESGDPKTEQQGFELSKIMLQIHPTSPESNLIYADYLIRRKEPKDAAGYYYRATIHDRRNFMTWGKLLLVEYQLGSFDSLEHHSFSAMELFPSQPSAYLYNGLANIQLKNYKKAAQSLSDGIEFVVDNKNVLLDFYRSLGDASYYLKDYPRSDKAFEEALKIDSDNTYVLNNYAYFLSLRKENLEKAERLSKKTLELRPNDNNYMDTYGWILYEQKKYTEASEWLQRASKAVPVNPNILEHYGDVLYRLNKPSEALQQWNAARQAGGNSESLLKKIKDKKIND